jgi:hypothetical protein
MGWVILFVTGFDLEAGFKKNGISPSKKTIDELITLC